MKLNFSLYFFVFIIFLLLRSLWEFFILPKKEFKNTSNKGIFTLIVFLMSYGVSCTAVWILLVVSNNVKPVLFISGMVILVLSYIGRIYSLRCIGDSYSQYTEPVMASNLVTLGIYSKIRNPLYVFFTLELIGLILVKINIYSFFALVANSVATGIRISQEERMLEAKFGEEFREYKSRTKRIIPFLF